MDHERYKTMPFEYKVARFSLLLRKAYPFIGELCMRVEKFYKHQQGFASTDGLRLFLDVEKLNKLPEELLNFVLLHDLFHIMLRQCYPKGMPYYEKIYWNIAFDLVANWLLMSMSSELKRHGLPIVPIADTPFISDNLSEDPSNRIAKAFINQAIDQGILSENPPPLIEIKWKSYNVVIPNNNSRFSDMLSDDSVHEVSTDSETQGLERISNDDSLSTSSCRFIPDILDNDSASNTPTEAEIQELLTSCEKSAGHDGLPKYLKDLWDELAKNRRIPWYLIFRRFLEGMKEGEEFDFCPPDKRMLYSKIILPAETIDDGSELNNALVILDVSSSVDKKELLAQIWQVNSILKGVELNGSIISFGTSIYQEARLSNKASLKKFIDNLKVGGGTNWESVVAYAKKSRLNYRPIIVFTDGYFYSYDKGLTNVIFITQRKYPERLTDLGKVIQIMKF